MAKRQNISVSVDCNLLEYIDRLDSNRSEIVNQALTEWRKQRILAEIKEGYAKSKPIDPMIAEGNLLLNDLALEADEIVG